MKDVEMLPGVVRRTLDYTDRLMVIRVRFVAGASLPAHSHPHDQSSYIESGRFRYTIGGKTRDFGPGEGVIIPGGTEHGAVALEDAVVVDSFAPARQDFIDD